VRDVTRGQRDTNVLSLDLFHVSVFASAMESQTLAGQVIFLGLELREKPHVLCSIMTRLESRQADADGGNATLTLVVFVPPHRGHEAAESIIMANERN
jgi:hypothetical protein